MKFNHPLDIAHFLNTPSKKHEDLAREIHRNIEENNIKTFKHRGGYVSEITLLSNINKFRDAHLICQAFYSLYKSKCTGELIIEELLNNYDNQNSFNIIWSFELYEKQYNKKKLTYNRRLLIIIWLVNLFSIGTLIYNFNPIYTYLLFLPIIFGIVLAFIIHGKVNDAARHLRENKVIQNKISNYEAARNDKVIQNNISNGEAARNDKVIQNKIINIYKL